MVKKSGAPASGQEVPLDIYGSLVDALFEVQASLFIGSTAASLAALITAWRANSVTLFGFGLVIAVVTYLRVLDMLAYKRARPDFLVAPDFRHWENRYIIGATIYGALLGLWCLASFVISDDPFVRLFAFSVVIAYMIGTSGRNFSSNALVVAQAAGSGIPLALAMVYLGGLYWAVLIIVLVPFFLAIKLISDRLRKQLLTAVISERNVSQIAAQFDTALRNMPHGLGMFDEKQALQIGNRQLAKLLGFPSETSLVGKPATEMLLASPTISGATDIDHGAFVTDFRQRLQRAEGVSYVEISGAPSLSFTTQPMASGGSVVIVEDITERRHAEQRIRHLARYDSLTGLPNRAVFHDELSDALVRSEGADTLAVLFIDLDQFKQVNDSLGHPVGDQLLCAVAERLRIAMGDNHIVARFGGDEFAVLQAGCPSAKDATLFAERIIRTLSRPYEIAGHVVIIGASVGIALAPQDGRQSDVLLKNADLALYHAKADGAGRSRLFEPEMDLAVRARRALEIDLRNALNDDKLEIYYQPQIDLKTMRIIACEALLRWNHPTRGMVPPSEFIPVAEEMGIIVEIGDWVLRQACIECTRWPAMTRVAVNLSSVQFRRSDVAATVARALQQSGLAADRLEVEITESLVVQDIEAALETLQKLRQTGVRVALDDFGTGYSGLSYLQTFPLNKVKIDRSFVQQITSVERSRILLRGVAELSAALGMAVVVEGIETNEQLEIVLAERSIDEAQGYLFSMPLPAAAIRELLASSAPRELAASAGLRA